jgi:hypothetical protein
MQNFPFSKFTIVTSGTSSPVLVHNQVLECTILLRLQAEWVSSQMVDYVSLKIVLNLP